MDEFTMDQMTELRALEKTSVQRGGSGFRPHVQELIDRLKSGGVGPSADQSLFGVYSKVLWDKGWGRVLGFQKLDAYRKSLEREGLVVCPERPAGVPDHLDRCILWDRRPLLVKKDRQEVVSLVKACRLLGVSFSGDDDTLIQHDGTPEITVPVRWVWCQDGRRNRHRKPSECRESFHAPEVALEALGGLFLYAQGRSVIGGEGANQHVMDLPGSVHRGSPSGCAYLRLWGERPGLYWHWSGRAHPKHGSASRGE